MTFNFDALSTVVEAATRSAFTELATLSGKEKLYAFALYSDESAMTLCPAANTLEYFDDNADEEDLAYYKFEPAEWKYEMQGAEAAFDAISRNLREAKKDATFHQRLRETCVNVLANLKAEGFFRSLAGQEVFLLYSISDADQEPEIIQDMIHRLNDNPYKQEYLNWINRL